MFDPPPPPINSVAVLCAIDGPHRRRLFRYRDALFVTMLSSFPGLICFVLNRCDKALKWRRFRMRHLKEDF